MARRSWAECGGMAAVPVRCWPHLCLWICKVHSPLRLHPLCRKLLLQCCSVCYQSVAGWMRFCSLGLYGKQSINSRYVFEMCSFFFFFCVVQTLVTLESIKPLFTHQSSLIIWVIAKESQMCLYDIICSHFTSIGMHLVLKGHFHKDGLVHDETSLSIRPPNGKCGSLFCTVVQSLQVIACVMLLSCCPVEAVWAAVPSLSLCCDLACGCGAARCKACRGYTHYTVGHTHTVALCIHYLSGAGWMRFSRLGLCRKPGTNSCF